MTSRLQPAVRGGEPTRKKGFFVDEAFRLCPLHFACTAYLEPISGSLHVPIERVYRVTEKIEDRSRIGAETAQTHVENRRQTYLEAIRNTMQKPVGGLSAQVLRNQAKVEPIYRGGIDNLHALVQHSVMSALALS
jgi:hypothetical protein